MSPDITGIHIVWPGTLDILARATLVMVLSWVAHPALYRANPRWRVALWRGTLAALLALPVVASITPEYTLILPDTAGAATGILSVLTADSPVAAGAGWGLTQWLVLLWAAGVVVSLGSILKARLGLAALISGSSGADDRARELLESVVRAVGYRGRIPELRFTSAVEVPFVCGLIRPSVVLPYRMLEYPERNELGAVLAHEVSHLRSGDLAWNLLAQVLRSLLWFHPLARPVPDVHRAACEDVCNVTAAGYVGDMKSYSQTLARVALSAVRRPFAEGGIPMATRSTILQRLDFLKKGIGAAPLPRAARGWAALTGLCLLVAFSGLNFGCSDSTFTTSDKMVSPELSSLSSSGGRVHKYYKKLDPGLPGNLLTTPENFVEMEIKTTPVRWDGVSETKPGVRYWMTGEQLAKLAERDKAAKKLLDMQNEMLNSTKRKGAR